MHNTCIYTCTCTHCSNAQWFWWLGLESVPHKNVFLTGHEKQRQTQQAAIFHYVATGREQQRIAQFVSKWGSHKSKWLLRNAEGHCQMEKLAALCSLQPWHMYNAGEAVMQHTYWRENTHFLNIHSLATTTLNAQCMQAAVTCTVHVHVHVYITHAGERTHTFLQLCSVHSHRA